jgi:hypothetical protein
MIKTIQRAQAYPIILIIDIDRRPFILKTDKMICNTGAIKSIMKDNMIKIYFNTFFVKR